MTAVANRLAASERLDRQAWLARLLSGEAPDGPWPEEGRLGELAACFRLTPFETDAVGLLWVLAFAPELRRLCAGDDGPVTPLLVAGLFRHPATAWLPSEAPTLLWRILRELPRPEGSPALVLDPHILAWLEGEHELDRALLSRVRMVTPGRRLPSWPLESTALRLGEGLREGVAWRVILRTHDGQAAAAFAAAVAELLGLPLLYLEHTTLPGDEIRTQAIHLQRQAFLDRVAPMVEATNQDHTHLPHLPVFPIQFIWSEAPVAAVPGIRDVTCELGPPGLEERLGLWCQAMPEAEAWPEGGLLELARGHEADFKDILQVADLRPADATTAARLLNQVAREDLGGLAQHLECGFRWQDLVLPPSVEGRLRDITFEARERTSLWAEPEARRLYPQGRGLVALFAGPPGTGKTMAAQVIAAELGLDLLRVDLSAVISKWVGETAQHLQKILSARSSRRAVLFFDEADALYGKRVEEVKDAQDRFANQDISHLMVALEDYDGIVFLATNLKANIDPAFIRRIRYVVDFPRPDARARLEIWTSAIRALFGPSVASGLSADLDQLAALDSTGAQIKNAALSAVFAARRAGSGPILPLLGRMLASELAKDGIGLSERDLQAMTDGSEVQP